MKHQNPFLSYTSCLKIIQIFINNKLPSTVVRFILFSLGLETTWERKRLKAMRQGFNCPLFCPPHSHLPADSLPHWLPKHSWPLLLSSSTQVLESLLPHPHTVQFISVLSSFAFSLIPMPPACPEPSHNLGLTLEGAWVSIYSAHPTYPSCQFRVQPTQRDTPR